MLVCLELLSTLHLLKRECGEFVPTFTQEPGSLPIISLLWVVDATTYFGYGPGRVLWRDQAYYVQGTPRWKVTPGDMDGWWLACIINYTDVSDEGYALHVTFDITENIPISRPGRHVERICQIYFKDQIFDEHHATYELVLALRRHNGPIVIQDQWEKA